jgi:broad specificity phosphatase PhoE
MNRVFYIFRHGETDWNKERKCQGHTDIALNETGVLQAHELAHKVLDFNIEVIYSSDLSRAKQTGSIVAEKLNVPIKFDSRLREMSYGEAEGMLYQEAIEKFGELIWQQLQSFKSENDHVGFPGGETRYSSRLRFSHVLDEIIKNTTHQKIGLSTHGGALRNILQSFLPEEHSILPIPNCVVYKLEYDASSKEFKVDVTPL